MLKIAIAAALAAIVLCDAAVSSLSTPATATVERPRGLKGDRLPVFTPATGCPDATRPFSHECVNTRKQPAAPTPASQLVGTIGVDSLADAASIPRLVL